METLSELTITELLEVTERNLYKYCRAKKISVRELKDSADKFSEEELNDICELLKTKLRCQRSLFETGGGELGNIRFISRYR